MSTLATQIEQGPFFLLRTPILPASSLEKISAQSLLNYWKDPIIQEAIFLASYDLYNQLKLLTHDDFIQRPITDKTLQGLLKYLSRMSYRCTPFGVFAGTAFGRWSDKTAIRLFNKNTFQKKVRLNAHSLSEIISTIYAHPGIKNNLSIFANNTTYLVHEQIRYIESRKKGLNVEHTISSIQHTPEIETILNSTRTGMKYIDIVELLIQEGHEQEDAIVFIDQLIEEQLLITEADIQLTNTNNLDKLLNLLGSKKQATSIHTHLHQIKDLLNTINKEPIGHGIGTYETISKTIPTLGSDYNHIQVDLELSPQKITINEDILGDLKKTILLLLQLPVHHGSQDLQQFKSLFLERYGQKEMPLLHVLDTDIGIGYPAQREEGANSFPYLASYDWSTKKRSEWTINDPWQEYLIKIYSDALRNGVQEIELVEEDIANYLDTTKRLPPTFYSMVQMYSTPNSNNFHNNYQLSHELTSGPSSWNLMTRFCDEESETIALIKELAKNEEDEQPNKIYAEIVHLSDYHVANISFRPGLFQYETPLLTRSSNREENIIRLEDITISILHERIVLRSKKHGKEVIPRLSNAHNYKKNTLPHYHFLCDLQTQDCEADITWYWGILENAPYLPRVRYKSCILSRSRWKAQYTDVVKNEQASDAEIDVQLNEWIKKHKIPNAVRIVDGDNHLPIYFSNFIYRQLFLSICKKKSPLFIEENLFTDENMIVEGTDGTHTNEVIIPFRWRTPALKDPSTQLVSPISKEVATQRTFAIGNDWLYFKIYCPPGLINNLLVQTIAPLFYTWEKSKLADLWFFVRYKDPDPHVRIRFHKPPTTPNEAFLSRIITGINEALGPKINDGTIRTIQIENYERELERYGDKTMEDSETFFYHDTTAIIKSLDCIQNNDIAPQLWQIAMISIDTLLDSFDYTMTQKQQLLDALQIAYKSEQGYLSREKQYALSKIYRKCQLILEETLRPGHPIETTIRPIHDIFLKRNNDCLSTFQNIRAIHLKEPQKIEPIIVSFIHMSLNRIFTSHPRKHELIVYDHLNRYYKSMLARQIKQ